MSLRETVNHEKALRDKKDWKAKIMAMSEYFTNFNETGKEEYGKWKRLIWKMKILKQDWQIKSECMVFSYNCIFFKNGS